jgi:3-hydroxypropanoate dehydrogenase
VELTSSNCSSARIVFIKSTHAKQELVACISSGNAQKIWKAPVTAIIEVDMVSCEKLPELFHAKAKPWFAGNQAVIDATALRNSLLLDVPD